MPRAVGGFHIRPYDFDNAVNMVWHNNHFMQFEIFIIAVMHLHKQPNY